MAPSCSAALSEKTQQQGTSAHPCRLHPHTDSARDGGIKASSLHQLLGHQLGMLRNTPLTNLRPQLWRMEFGGDLFLGKRQSIPVLLNQQRCQGTEASLHNRNQVLHGGGGPSPAISDAFVLVGDLDTLTSTGPSIFSSEDPWLHIPHPSTHSGLSGLLFLVERTKLKS